MMTKNNERKQELVEYIELLGKLQGNGLKYNTEINKAVKELDSIVMDKPKCVIEKFYSNVSCDNGKSGKLVIVDTTHRGVGKTRVLAIFAKINRLPIIVGNITQKEYVLNESKKWYEEVKEVYTVSDLRGRKFPNGVLIDDTVSMSDVEKIKSEYNTIICGGFVYSDLYI